MRSVERRARRLQKFFVDYFCLRQCRPDFKEDTILDAIKRIDSTVMLMDPWDKPFALSRTFCVFEVYGTISQGVHFQVCMPPQEQQRFCAQLDALESKDAKLEALAIDIRVQEAQASNPKDKERIDDFIEKGPGFEKVNKMVLQAVQTGLMEAFEEQVGDVESGIAVLAAKVESVLANCSDIKKEDIVLLKNMLRTRPPKEVSEVCKAIHILLTGGTKGSDLPQIRKTMNNPRMGEQIHLFDKEDIPEKVVRQVSAITEQSFFNAEALQQKSRVCGVLGSWVLAVLEYNTHYKALQEQSASLRRMRSDRHLCQQAVAAS
eukprot:TRINITY_DN47664_c0_g1_i1.p1 TRINITY_DN47664_c0_g1~~TRINITY_DN47664_c0_g1_i1.p1  ORF type:complete len:319 (-),score=106.77 TRINITY_DN47664_c0_g1_i1:532-1488(-)